VIKGLDVIFIFKELKPTIGRNQSKKINSKGEEKKR